ncbi:DUF3768 domain-containing protein [Neorhizobium galegae]|uniref:DUF3768 domain-containing protein n=1 Tax=Neorhizobium galegae TaxID=399 RepID=UPI00210095FE|nr:DUF3768 domain-containing protein [Neorhizobium galegae]MCQ1573470.1 DUF3768 domain-containing protein [Neorhizobium galegae]
MSNLAVAVRNAVSMSSGNTDRIQMLNDRLRQKFIGGRIMLTTGVQALDDEDRRKLLAMVQNFDQFAPGNDPYGEHDFGRVNVGGAGYFWKIEYYDFDLESASPDPADETVTTRVITIMREDEY